MKRRTICVLVMMAALLAAAPGWAVPATRVSSPVDQVFEWLGLGTVWSALWADTGGCVDPNGDCAAAVPSEWAETGNCVDPNGRPAPCPGAAPSGSYTIDPAGGRPQ